MKKRIWIYIILFYSIWTLNELFIFKIIDIKITNDINNQILKTIFIKNFIWTVPSLLLIYKYSDNMFVKFKEIFNYKIKWKTTFILLFLFTLYILIGAYINNGTLSLQHDFNLSKIIIVLFVGITEESVFRGLLLNFTYKNDKISIMVNSLMFLMIHFPKWIATGTFISVFTSFSFLSIIILSLIFSKSLINNKSLIPGIILHSYWDLLMFMFY